MIHSIARFRADLAESGIKISLLGEDQIEITAPHEPSPDILDQIRRHKHALIALLREESARAYLGFIGERAREATQGSDEEREAIQNERAGPGKVIPIAAYLRVSGPRKPEMGSTRSATGPQKFVAFTVSR